MNTEKQLQLVTFEQAKALKELGFDWDCETFYIHGDLDNCHNLINYNTNEGLIQNPDYYDENETDDGYCSAPTVALALKFILSKIDNYTLEIQHNKNPNDDNFIGFRINYEIVCIVGNFSELFNEIIKYLKSQKNETT